MNDATERKRAERARRKAQGYVERTIWVCPELWVYIQGIVDALNRANKEESK